MFHYSHPHFKKKTTLSSKPIRTYHRSTAHLIWHRRLQTSNTGTQWHGQWLLCKVLPKKDEKKHSFFEVVGRQSHLRCLVKYLQIKLVYIYSRHVNIINHHKHLQNTHPIPSHMPGVLLYLASLFGISFHIFFVARSWFVSWGFPDLSWSIPMWFKLLKLSGWCHWCPCWFHLNY